MLLPGEMTGTVRIEPQVSEVPEGATTIDVPITAAALSPTSGITIAGAHLFIRHGSDLTFQRFEVGDSIAATGVYSYAARVAGTGEVWAVAAWAPALPLPPAANVSLANPANLANLANDVGTLATVRFTLPPNPNPANAWVDVGGAHLYDAGGGDISRQANVDVYGGQGDVSVPHMLFLPLVKNER
jgi:hypothetical protein